jgi:hypothetical protein
MPDKPADQPPTIVEPQTAARERQTRAAEQRAFRDALEDDEVYECLLSLRAKEQGSPKKPRRA